MKKIQFNDSELLYPVGLGTWQMGEITSNKQNELNTIFYAIDSGIQLIDTAEMYAIPPSPERLEAVCIILYPSLNPLVIEDVLVTIVPLDNLN